MGDDADEAFFQVLSRLPPTALDDARASGRQLGEHVYSRRFLDDDLRGAVATLSRAIAESGAGELLVADAFHRTATVRFRPAPRLAPAHPAVSQAFVSGVLEGFLASAFNCQAFVHPHADALQVRLGEGRDVNRRGSAA